jgi:hypothetical protein
MPDWRISFTISGKRLDPALAVVHKLRSEDLSVIPVAETQPRSGSAPVASKKKGTISAAILVVLKHHPKGANAKTVSDALNRAGVETTPRNVNSRLHGMVTQKLITRKGHGLYAVKKGK